LERHANLSGDHHVKFWPEQTGNLSRHGNPAEGDPQYEHILPAKRWEEASEPQSGIPSVD